VEYLSDQYNLGLVPKDPYERAKGKIVIDVINKKIIPAYFRTVQAQERDKQESAKDEFTAALKEFAEKLPKDDGPFYGGKTFGFVDVELVPWILRSRCVVSTNDRFYIIEEHRGFKLPGPEEGPVWKRFAEWKDAVLQQESVQHTRSEDQYYEQVRSHLDSLMNRYIHGISTT
jgi:glutathione S-transferase